MRLGSAARYGLALLTSAIMSCEDFACPAIAIPDTFVLIFDDAPWTATTYVIEVSYSQLGKNVTYTCPVRVPAVVLDRAAPEDGDAGSDTLSTDAGTLDAGAPAQFNTPENLSCTAAPGNESRVSGRVGRTINLTFDDTPARIHVIVRKAGETAFDETIELEYEKTYPTGPNCGKVLGASHRIDLRSSSL